VCYIFFSIFINFSVKKPTTKQKKTNDDVFLFSNRDSLVLVDFQGIFCRNPATPVTNSNNTSIELRVEKAWMQVGAVIAHTTLVGIQ
jgi:hypothetical protein